MLGRPYTNKTLSLRQYSILFAEQQEETIQTCTPKSKSVLWNPDERESGNFSEYKGLGGIMGFDSRTESSTLAFLIAFVRGRYSFFSCQFSSARMLGLLIFYRLIILSPFEKRAFASSTPKRRKIRLNPSPKPTLSGGRSKLTFSHQQACHSGRIPAMLA